MRIRKKLLSIAAVLMSVVSIGSLAGKKMQNVVAEKSAMQMEVSVLAPQTVLAKYYIKNAKYVMPTLYENGMAVSSSVKVEANGSEVSVQNGTFTVPATETLTFTFTTENGDVVENRPVVDVNFGGSLAIDQYFIATGGSVMAEKSNLVFTSTESTSKYQFVRELDAKKFSTQFKILEDMGNFEKVTFTLTDFMNANKVITMSVVNDDGSASLSVNGAKQTRLNRAFESSTTNYILSLNENKITVGDTSVTFDSYVDGTAFEGFSFAYMDVTIEGASDNASMVISTLNSQPLNNLKMDALTPNTFFTGEYGGEVGKGETYTVNPIYAVDVLDPYTEITFSVRVPSGGYATSTDGKELKNVSATEVYTLIANEYGKYSFTYSYKDTSGNSDGFTVSLSVLDVVKPVVTPEKEVIRGKVGQALNVPAYQVTDDNTSTEDIIVSIQVIDSEYKLSTIKSGKTYVPTKAGVYTIRYMAIDGNNNLGFAEVICVVS